jgi:hypothetical protein
MSRATKAGAAAGGIAAFVVTLTVAHRARAYDASVDATLDAQFYDVPSPYGNPIVRRRRYTETLSLRVYGLEGKYDPRGPELFAIAKLRLDADFGQDPAEHGPVSAGGTPIYATDLARFPGGGQIDANRFVPGLQEAPLDIMTAYVEGRRYFRGLFGFRLGRQYVIDALGFWSFDGGLVRLTTPAHFTVEAYGGFEQRGGLPMLATPRFEADGVYRGDRTSMNLALWPSYLDEAKLAPAYGFAVESSGLDFLATRLTYRRVIDRDVVITSPYPDAQGAFMRLSGDRISTERVGWAATATAKDLGGARAELVYDLYASRLSTAAGSLDWFVTKGLGLGADYDYYVPTFDGDSIWNWFAHYGTTTLRGRARLDASRRWAFGATLGARRFDTEGDPNAGATPGTARSSLYDLLGTLEANYRAPDLRGGLRLSDEHGDRGLRRGGDFSVRRFFDRGVWDASTVLSLYRFEDPLRQDAAGAPLRNATSLTYVLGGGYHPLPVFRAGLEWEHSLSDLVGNRFRLLATLALTEL